MAELFLLPEKPVSQMDREELLAMKSFLETRIAQLDIREPADAESEEYEDWADEHEDWEDQLDEVLDLVEI